MDIPHIPVLLEEVLKSFDGLKGGKIVDCTIGYAGHSSSILQRYKHLSIVGIDRDTTALNFSKERLKEYKNRVELIKGSFSEKLPEILQSNSDIVGILADFGVSSLQLDQKERGFSFDSDTLDMRMDKDAPLSAYDVVNSYSQEKLSYIFKKYGEIPNSDQIAKKIIEYRAKKSIESAKELQDILKPYLRSKTKIHPATLLFQAIRIEVNDELGEIERLLEALYNNPLKGGVVSLITFHSLEDRLVKNAFREWAKSCICPKEAIRCNCGNNHSLGKPINKKPITATLQELKKNSRSRSAKLRSFRFKE